MKQETRVYSITEAQGKELSHLLTHAGWEFRSLQHATFQAKGDGFVVSCYRSGKLVVQGKQADFFEETYLSRQVAARRKKKLASEITEGREEREKEIPRGNSLGSDEAGKGDTFGGLVVCAVAVAENQWESLQAAGIDDSKTLTDKRMQVLAPWLMEAVDHEIICLTPSQYNEGHLKNGKNVNKLLTQLHTEVLQKLSERTSYRIAIVDRFGSNLPVTKEVSFRKLPLSIYEVPRAEAYIPVAAASILARISFVDSMKALEETWGIDIPLGSGAPVPPALRRFLQIHGKEKLPEVAKVHFQNLIRIASSHEKK